MLSLDRDVMATGTNESLGISGRGVRETGPIRGERAAPANGPVEVRSNPHRTARGGSTSRGSDFSDVRSCDAAADQIKCLDRTREGGSSGGARITRATEESACKKVLEGSARLPEAAGKLR